MIRHARVRAVSKAFGTTPTVGSATATHFLLFHPLPLQFFRPFATFLLGFSFLRLSHRLINLLLVGIHLYERLNLSQIHAFPVPEGNDLVESKDQIERILDDFLLFQRAAIFRDLKLY